MMTKFLSGRGAQLAYRSAISELLAVRMQLHRRAFACATLIVAGGTEIYSSVAGWFESISWSAGG